MADGTEPVVFDRDSANIIQDVVSDYVNSPLDNTNKPHRIRQTSDRFLWAKISGNSVISGNHWKYSWAEQRRTATGFEDMPNGRTGTENALNIEEVGGWAVSPIDNDTVVLLRFAVTSSGAATYTFGYNPFSVQDCDESFDKWVGGIQFANGFTVTDGDTGEALISLNLIAGHAISITDVSCSGITIAVDEDNINFPVPTINIQDCSEAYSKARKALQFANGFTVADGDDADEALVSLNLTAGDGIIISNTPSVDCSGLTIEHQPLPSIGDCFKTITLLTGISFSDKSDCFDPWTYAVTTTSLAIDHLGHIIPDDDWSDC